MNTQNAPKGLCVNRVCWNSVVLVLLVYGDYDGKVDI